MNEKLKLIKDIENSLLKRFNYTEIDDIIDDLEYLDGLIMIEENKKEGK